MIYNTFTASNSYKGFYSLFDRFLNENPGKNIYLIKGGPGCGKSTFMKKVSDKLEKNGHTIEQVLCSSDPDSLDGIKTEDNSITIIDATAPHSFDMRYPGAVDSIIDLSLYWDKNKLIDHREDIVLLSDEITKNYSSVYSLLNIAGLLYADNLRESADMINVKEINEYISKHMKQNGISPIDAKANCSSRFLSALNCKGIVTLDSTANILCDAALVIEDDVVNVDIIMKKLLFYLQKCGYSAITFYNPLYPKKIDHIILPQLRYGFFTSNKIFSLNLDVNLKIKRIDASRFVNKSHYENIKTTYSLKKKTILKIISEATHKLENIKLLHDQLESYYINAMDYEKLNKFTEQFIDSLFLY